MPELMIQTKPATNVRRFLICIALLAVIAVVIASSARAEPSPGSRFVEHVESATAEFRHQDGNIEAVFRVGAANVFLAPSSRVSIGLAQVDVMETIDLGDGSFTQRSLLSAVCHPSESFGDIFGLPPTALDFRQDAASLDETFACDATGGPDFPLAVHLVWAASSDPSCCLSHPRRPFTFGEIFSVGAFTDVFRPAVVSGTASDGQTDFAAAPFAQTAGVLENRTEVRVTP